MTAVEGEKECIVGSEDRKEARTGHGGPWRALNFVLRVSRSHRRVLRRMVNLTYIFWMG